MHIFILASSPRSLLNFRGPLIREIISLGNRVSVGAPNISNKIRNSLELIGADVYETPLQRNGIGVHSDLQYLTCLIRLFRRLKPDIVLTYTIKPNIWGALAASITGAQSTSMVTGLGYAFSEADAGWRWRFWRWAIHRLYRAATKKNRIVVFQNQDDRDDFLSSGCLANPSKARLVNGSGVDLQHFSATRLPDSPVFLMVARLLVSKGVREFVEAARLLREQHKEARFILVGPHDEGPDSVASDVFSEWIREGIVEWSGGHIEDVRPVIREAAVFVLPSYREGTPRSVLEAMAMGRPIVTTNAPGCRETVIEGDNGFLVPIGDSEALANAMKRFIVNPSLKNLMGRRSYELACLKYDVRKVNIDMIRILGL